MTGEPICPTSQNAIPLLSHVFCVKLLAYAFVKIIRPRKTLVTAVPACKRLNTLPSNLVKNSGNIRSAGIKPIKSLTALKELYTARAKLNMNGNAIDAIVQKIAKLFAKKAKSIMHPTVKNAPLMPQRMLNAKSMCTKYIDVHIQKFLPIWLREDVQEKSKTPSMILR